ncbi:Nucleoside-triphosphatase THEP1 [Euphorbia peplus]|nr:Nucleoside-triphosphatase THEP1 [Euphorbia peplus]
MEALRKCLVLLTGAPAVGKTTLIIHVFETLQISNPNLKIQGFFTREIKEWGKRVGFEVVTLDGRKAPIASSKISTPQFLKCPTVGKYKVDIASFESLALPELQVKEDTDLFIIDEVGRMELFSSDFFPAVLKILESNVPVLASVPIPNYGRDIPAVARVKNHPGATIYTVDPSNRDALKEQICAELVGSLTPHR